jgi:hypothetical protein
MSIKVVEGVLDHSKATGAARLVLVVMATYASDRGECWPSITTLARRTNFTPRYVTKLIRELEKSGEIETEQSEGRVSRYRIPLNNRTGANDKTPLNNSSPPPLNNSSETPEPLFTRTVKNRQLNHHSLVNDEGARQNEGKNHDHETRPGNGSGDGADTQPSGSEPEAPKAEVQADPARQAFDAWNDLAAKAGLPIAQKLTTTRKRKLKDRVADCGGIDGFTAVLSTLPQSDFLTGRKTGFKASLDFVCQPSSFEKLRDGNYHDKPPTPQKPLSPDDLEARRQRLASLTAY